MTLYKTTITPTSNFSTALKGDTLFGQMCWAVRFAFGNDRLNELLSDYNINPFLIVSDGFASGYLPKPTMPSLYLNEDRQKKNENRKKIWLTSKQLQSGEFNQAKTDKDIGNHDISKTVVRNSVNNKTSMTGGDGFDPYGEHEIFMSAKDIYFLIRDDFKLDELKQSLELVSGMGYGRDRSIGKGRFQIGSLEEMSFGNDSAAYMALGPFSPNGLECKDLFYEPFTRFGKSGASRANANPFKKPILLANSGAVVCFEDSKKIEYIGMAIRDISAYKDTVHQGYSIVVPIKELSNG